MPQGRIVIADNHLNMLAGVHRLLKEEVETILMVGDEISLNHALEHFNPNVVLADISFPVSKERNVAWFLKKNFPKINVIILSVGDEKAAIDDVMAAGVEGFVLKHRAVIDLIPAIRGCLSDRGGLPIGRMIDTVSRSAPEHQMNSFAMLKGGSGV